MRIVAFLSLSLALKPHKKGNSWGNTVCKYSAIPRRLYLPGIFKEVELFNQTHACEQINPSRVQRAVVSRKVIKLLLVDQIQSTIYFCMAHELRIVFTLLNGYKQYKEDYPFTGENCMEFKF